MRTWLLLLSPWLSSTALAAELWLDREPGSFAIRTLDGDTETQTVGEHGVLSIRGRSASQTLSWQLPAGPLASTAHHELDLIVESARVARGRLSTDGFVHAARVVDRDALSWSATVDNTLFVGTSIDCPSTRVVITTFGPNPSTVQRIHQRSLDSLVCKR